MAPHRSTSIVDFFKRPTQSRSAKRSAPDNDIEPLGSRQKSRSVSPKGDQNSTLEHASTEEHAHLPSRRSAGPLNLVNSEVAARSTYHKATSTLQDGDFQKSQKTATEASNLSSSQGPLITSSQRIIKNGQVMIRNSDDEDSDSDASLKDIDEILRSRKTLAEAASSPLTEPDSSTLTPVGSCISEPDTEAMPQMRASAGIRKAARSTSTSPRVPQYKFDMHSLVKRRRKDEISEAGISKAKSALEDIGRIEKSALEEVHKGATNTTKIDPGMITSVMKSHGDSSDASRLMMAIQRTEALQTEKSWSFFETDYEPSDIEQSPFKYSATRSWHHMLQDVSSRQQLFLGGFMGDIATKGDLPDQLLLWLVNAVSIEPREDLRYSYSHTLKDAAREVGSLIEPYRIDALFQRIGARLEALRVEKPVVALAQGPYKIVSIPHRPRLVSVLKLLGDIAPHLNQVARRHTVCLLCRLLLDHNLSHDPAASLAIEEAFGCLIDSVPDGQIDDESTDFLTTIYNTVTDLSLRSQLIHKFPAMPARLTLLRRRLSLAFFFQNPAYLSKPQNELVRLRYVSHHLATEKSMIGMETDFAELGAMILLLNVGVDCGDPPPAGIDTGVRKVFDKEVDELSYVVKSISKQIKEAGASQLKKTEAKEILEDFNARLMYAVRISSKSDPQLFGKWDIRECWQKAKEPQNSAEKEMSNGVVNVGSK